MVVATGRVAIVLLALAAACVVAVLAWRSRREPALARLPSTEQRASEVSEDDAELAVPATDRRHSDTDSHGSREAEDSPPEGESASAPPPSGADALQGVLGDELAARYANHSVHDLQGALDELGRRREELARPLLERKLQMGDFFQDEPIQGDQMYNSDTARWHGQELQPVLRVRLEKTSGSDLKVPKVVCVNPDEDPDLLMVSLEHLWLQKRLRQLRKKE